MPEKLRVGIVGLGRGRHLASCLRQVGQAEVVGVCDLNGELKRQLADSLPGAAFFSRYEDLLDIRPDAVVVATPPRTHVDYTVKALKRDMHVLCEVPAFDNHGEIAPLVEAVRRSKGLYMLAENAIYWAFVHSVRQEIQSGRLGKIMYAEAEYVHAIPPSMCEEGCWRRGYPPIKYCTHSLGPLLEWMDEDIVAAVALHSGVQMRPEMRMINAEAALLQTGSGSVIKLLCCFNVVREPPFHRYVLYGTKGFFEKTAPMDGDSRYFLQTAADGQTGRPAPVAFSETWQEDRQEPALAALHGGADYRMVKAFVESCRRGGPSPIGIDKAIRMTLPGICAHESAERGGSPVQVERWSIDKPPSHPAKD